MEITLESVPKTNQYYTIRVKFLAQGNNEAFDGARTHDWQVSNDHELCLSDLDWEISKEDILNTTKRIKSGKNSFPDRVTCANHNNYFVHKAFLRK